MQDNKLGFMQMSQQKVKLIHMKQIILCALQSKSITRAKLIQEMHLSPPSVSSLVDELLSKDVLTEKGVEQQQPLGRPSVLLSINPNAMTLLFVSMTIQGYQYVLYNFCLERIIDGFIPYIEQISNDDTSNKREVNPETLSRPLKQFIDTINGQYKLSALILSLPGNFDWEKSRFSSSQLNMMVSMDFIDMLKSPDLEIITGNRSDYLAYTEKFFQSMSDDYIFVNISEGVGAGIIHEGLIFSGTSMRSGEIGHISIDYQGRSCFCGNRGCLERYISIGAIVNEFKRLKADAGAQETPTDFESICRAYKQGDAIVVQILNDVAQKLIVGINNMLSIFNSSHIILGGGIEKLGKHFLDTVCSYAKNIGFRKVMDRVDIKYTLNTKEDESIGAVWNYITNDLDMNILIK